MVLVHGFRSIRYLLKGTFLSKKKSPKCCEVRQYIGLRHIDLFMHVNNFRMIEIFEFARWESLAASGWNARFLKGRCYPIVAATSINYFRTMGPFQVATVQTATVGISSNGSNLVLVQNLFDSKARLVATGTFFLSIVDFNTQKTLTVRRALERMGWDSASECCLCGDQELTLANVEKFSADQQYYNGVDRLAFYDDKEKRFQPRLDLVNTESLKATVNALAHFSRGFFFQRENYRSGASSSRVSSEPKGDEKK